MSIWTRFLGGSSAVEHRTLIPTVGGSNPPLPSISRRSFLKYAAAAPAVTYFLAPKCGWPTGIESKYVFETKDLAYKATERFSAGMTDWRGVFGTGRIMTASEFRKIVEPGLNRVFSETYDKHPEEWKRLFGGDGVALYNTSHPGWPDDA